MYLCPCRRPFDLHGVEQHRPATSGGIHSGLPARLDKVTKVSASEGPAGPAGSRPNMRLMHAQKYTAVAPFLSVSGRPEAARGIGPGTAGTRSGLTTLRAAAARAVSGFTPNTEENACAPHRLTRAKPSTAFQCCARRSATTSAAGLFSSALNSLINAPVLIPIGQGMEHMPSPAQVSIPSY